MKIKESRQIVGTFSETACLIRLFTQIAYNQIQDPSNEYWQWFLLIRQFLRFLTMQKITESQVSMPKDMELSGAGLIVCLFRSSKCRLTSFLLAVE